MPVHEIDAWGDERLAPYRGLKDRELALDGDLFLAEGEHVVRRLLASDYPTLSVLCAAKRRDALAATVGPDTPLYVVPDALVERIVGFKFHSGVLACGRRKPAGGLDETLAAAGAAAGEPRTRMTLMICPEVINHDNLGALIRIAAAFGATALILGERSCDPFWRRSIRVSMGTVFRLPIVRSEDLARDLARLREVWGMELAATVLDADAEPLAAARRPPRLGLLFGSESQGLHRRWLTMCDRRITLPMQLGTDSLNVAVAAAVFLYHFTREG